MVNKFVMAVAVAGLMTMGSVAMADGHDHKANDGAAKAEAKTGRKKRQLMCKDCGKPEKNCDCPEEVKKKEREEAAKEKAAE